MGVPCVHATLTAHTYASHESGSSPACPLLAALEHGRFPPPTRGSLDDVQAVSEPPASERYRTAQPQMYSCIDEVCRHSIGFAFGSMHCVRSSRSASSESDVCF